MLRAKIREQDKFEKKILSEKFVLGVRLSRKEDELEDIHKRIAKVANAEANRIISEWMPTKEIAEFDFRRAEQMANDRYLHDSGRKTMPRDDQSGEPAIVRKVIGRKRGSRKNI